jgi:hypothetical protein
MTIFWSIQIVPISIPYGGVVYIPVVSPHTSNTHGEDFSKAAEGASFYLQGCVNGGIEKEGRVPPGCAIPARGRDALPWRSYASP